MVPVLCYALVAAGWLSPEYSAEHRRPPQGVFVEAKLTAAEKERVRHLVQPADREPWLILDLAPTAPRGRWLAVYLLPDVESGRLRRGRVMYLEITATTVGEKPIGRVESIGKYAQVMVPGGHPDEGKRRWDLQRPFLVLGEFDDDTLFGLVELIRSEPEAPSRRTGAPLLKVRGSLPISSVRRRGNEVQVTLNIGHNHGWFVNLQERNGQLVVVEYQAWVASQD